MARALVSAIAEELGSIIASELRLTISVKEEVQKLESKFRTIQAVLNDAEKRQLKDETVKLWLDKLKDVSYEMDDVLDEWNTAMIKADIEKNDLVSILLGKGSVEERSPHVISLVGMSGIGKTTLAQLAYNDHDVKSQFEKRMWVCVSEPFDQCRIAKEILKSIEGQSPDMTSLQSLLDRICDQIMGKKFFLVLDDVWNEDPTLWEPFRLALRYGTQGSRIVVTTRKNIVAEIIGSVDMINLEVLSNEDCWLMFSKLAFFDKNPEEHKQLEDLGRKIAMKCKGLPLATKTLGSLMCFKRSREQWKNVLDSNLWELEDMGRSLFAPLLLSYYDLSSPLKRCLSYCAVFPKDYVFFIDELLFMWMILGYIDSKANMEIEVMAREYFENLAICSFFQDFVKDADGKMIGCKMHDIVHDFIQLMTKNECSTINSDKDLGIDYKNAHHLHLEILEEVQFPVSIYNAKKLRTLTLFNPIDYDLSKIFQYLRCLQALTLNCGLDGFPSSEPVYVVAPIGATFLRKRAAHLRVAPPRPRGVSSGAVPPSPSSTSTDAAETSGTGAADADVPPSIASDDSDIRRGVEFLGIESKNKKDDILFPNLKTLLFVNLGEWEEWIGIGEMKAAEEHRHSTIMPYL
ncbi:putative disease resistance protein RGA3 [Quercus robur]|uniref:putative disease resistance protein RGA3 n=1 Tax=Quercus robur TaxID=38942 RepID=UPI002162A6B0|nr:putative disease resistance protein RGA3 [Quercus robur]